MMFRSYYFFVLFSFFTPLWVLGLQAEETGLVNTILRFNTNVALADGTSSFDIELFDHSASSATRTTPITVANFLSYILDGSYTNSLIHRSVSGFVVQGGGFTWPQVSVIEAGGVPLPISKKAPIVNEAGNANLIGTIAMAKLSGDPDSATSQWFINLADNEALDNQNGGFTVFGKVVSGMELVSAIGANATYNFSSYFYYNTPFDELPLRPPFQSIDIDGAVMTVLVPSNYFAIQSIEILNRKSGTLTILQSSDLVNWSETQRIELNGLDPEKVFIKSELSIED